MLIHDNKTLSKLLYLFFLITLPNLLFSQSFAQLEAGVPLNARNKNGETALILLAQLVSKEKENSTLSNWRFL